MFSFTCLSEKQVLELRTKSHIYMTKTKRISIAGLNTKNVGYFARALDDVVGTVARVSAIDQDMDVCCVEVENGRCF